jgi:hypothetical protein
MSTLQKQKELNHNDYCRRGVERGGAHTGDKENSIGEEDHAREREKRRGEARKELGGGAH